VGWAFFKKNPGFFEPWQNGMVQVSHFLFFFIRPAVPLFTRDRSSWQTGHSSVFKRLYHYTVSEVTSVRRFGYAVECHWVGLGWAGLTSHSTQFRSFRRQCFYRSDDPTNSVRAL